MNYNYLVFNTNAQIKMHKQGENRDQMFMFSLESAIAADSFVRVLDAFVEAIDLKSFGFAPRIRRGRLCGLLRGRSSALSSRRAVKALYIWL